MSWSSQLPPANSIIRKNYTLGGLTRRKCRKATITVLYCTKTQSVLPIQPSLMGGFLGKLATEIIKTEVLM